MATDVELLIDMALRLAGESPAHCGYGEEGGALTVRRRLRQLVEPAAAQALREAPASVFATWRELDPEGVTVEADGRGYVLLPADFMRLLSFRMSDWRVAVERVDEARGACMGRLYPEAYASPSRPLCRLGQRPEGRVLLFAGSRSPAATLAQGLYVAQPRIDRRGTIEVPEELLAAIAGKMLAIAAKSEG